MPTLTRRAIPSESARVRQRRGRSPLSTSRLDRRSCSTPTRPVTIAIKVETNQPARTKGDRLPEKKIETAARR